ncbi:syntaxin-7-like isoform X2 [Littorina saxatilis]|uniref:Syntaxin-7 n=1 Tax=Littorina saxatilis TaxID=31220 RepID=A0AAN9G9L9_9CAEN
MASYGRGSFDGFDSYQGNQGAKDGGGSEFGKLSQKISQNIQKITQNVALVQRLVGQIGTPQDTEDIRNRAEQTIHYTNQLHKETSEYLKDFAHLRMPTSASEQRQFKMQKERFTDEFSGLLKNFQTIQREAVQKMRTSLQRARAHSGINQSPFQDTYEAQDDMMATPGVAIVTPGYSQTREVLQMEQDVDLELLREREDAIRKLEGDILDVNTIFKDLGMLVHEQGEQLDSIEANIDNAQMSVQEGTSQLSRARDYQQKSRRKMCILLLIFLVVVTIIALIIWGATR